MPPVMKRIILWVVRIEFMILEWGIWVLGDCSTSNLLDQGNGAILCSDNSMAQLIDELLF